MEPNVVPKRAPSTLQVLLYSSLFLLMNDFINSFSYVSLYVTICQMAIDEKQRDCTFQSPWKISVGNRLREFIIVYSP